MTSKSELQAKFNYRFSLLAKNPEPAGDDQPSNTEIQAYVNELLGVKKAKNSEDNWAML
jgi:hypothetical protein